MKILNALLVLFLILSCDQNIQTPDAPKNLIAHEKMVAIVKDLILIEGHIAITYKQIQSYHKIISASSNAIFKKHEVSKKRYVKSFEYYAANQGRLTGLYSDVLDELTEEKGKLDAPKT